MFWATAIFELIVFPIGLIGGIFSFLKRHIAVPILGSTLLLTSGALLLVLNTDSIEVDNLLNYYNQLYDFYSKNEGITAAKN